jgi:guanine deaminase
MTREEKFMQQAIELSQNGISNNEGGPFGCIIVKGDVVVGRGNNKVTSHNDPTAHAEVVAIRDACHNLGTFQLDDCEVYTSCEPCAWVPSIGPGQKWYTLPITGKMPLISALMIR